MIIVMPYRYEFAFVDEVYHVFNRSVAKERIFLSSYDYSRCVDLIDYYRFEKPPHKFSVYNRLPVDLKRAAHDRLKAGNQTVKILAFALMPNHFHLLLRPLQENAVSTYLRVFQNGYAKYFNTKYKRSGFLFQSMFKLVRVETDEQLMHVTRYIHLNPLTGYVIRELHELDEYPWTSWGAYMNNTEQTLIDTEPVSSFYPDAGALRDFTFDQLDYQRTLALGKHLLHDLEE